MKIFKSIKWRLQLWYGLILVLVLAGFGVTAYQLESGRQMRQVDDELRRRFAALADGLRPPRRGPDFGGQPYRQPPPGEPEMPPLQNFGPPVGFHLPPMAGHLFDTNDSNAYYFVIEAKDGKEIARGGDVPRHADAVLARVSKSLFPADFNSPISAGEPAKPPPARTVVITVHPVGHRLSLLATQKVSAYREMAQGLPSGEVVLVGCSVARQLANLHRTALEFSVVGGIILLSGLVGGRWMVERALRPIDYISSAATKIAAGDLSQRINVAETESELGRLAAVLNSTFARLETAFAQQQQFTADAAHELRTPVSVMLTQTQTALNRERDNAEYRDTVESCQRSAQRMRRLIESLLELARFDAGQGNIRRAPLDLRRLAQDCVDAVRPLAEEHGVKIDCELPVISCMGDADRLAQALTNLLANAVQYNRTGGEVRLKSESQGGVIIVTVADTGQGISKDDLPHIFERFYRADKSRSSPHAGLGLAMVKAIIEAHGGTVEAVSAEGTGTTFTLRLPT